MKAPTRLLPRFAFAAGAAENRSRTRFPRLTAALTPQRHRAELEGFTDAVEAAVETLQAVTGPHGERAA